MMVSDALAFVSDLRAKCVTIAPMDSIEPPRKKSKKN